MAYEYIVLTNEPNSLKRRFIRAYVRDTPNPEVRRIETVIALGDGPNTLDWPSLWASGVIIPNGAKAWNQAQLRETDDVGREAINAIWDVLRANGTLAQMIAAGTTALATDTRQTAAYTRLSTALIAGTNAERMQFLALVSVLSLSKIGQR